MLNPKGLIDVQRRARGATAARFREAPIPFEGQARVPEADKTRSDVSIGQLDEY
jgi:hypothetical protein